MTYSVDKVRADFPVLSREVNGLPLAYLDSAASDQKLVDKALYRRAGYPVSVSSGATPAASNAPSVESAQNGEPEQGNMLRATQ